MKGLTAVAETRFVKQKVTHSVTERYFLTFEENVLNI